MEISRTHRSKGGLISDNMKKSEQQLGLPAAEMGQTNIPKWDTHVTNRHTGKSA